MLQTRTTWILADLFVPLKMCIRENLRQQPSHFLPDKFAFEVHKSLLFITFALCFFKKFNCFMNRKIQTLKYIIFDFISAFAAWLGLYVFRKVYIESVKFGYNIPIEYGKNFFLGLILLPFLWLLFYYATGYYKDIYRKSRLQELGQTLTATTIGAVIIFFTLILDDTIVTYKDYYYSFFTFWALHFIFTYVPRLLITTSTIRKLRNRIIGFNTLIIGDDEKALQLYQEFESQKKSLGNRFVGFINISEKLEYLLSQHLTHLGGLNKVTEVIKNQKIEEVIIAIEASEHEMIFKIINRLEGNNVIIKIIPTIYEILRGAVNMSTPFASPLIEISHDLMPAWQFSLKRLFDIVVSIIALILLSPLYIALSVGVKLSSKGPIFYSHERIGLYGKPFLIYKFRSMFTDAEKHGPALSSKNDSRITPFGKFMRKSRLDELPQFYNVLIGDMSMVGPRPERQYFIDLITLKAPYYQHLHKVRPGITSWGQVKYGYAENVEEMIERLKYDLIYIENMSLYTDFKILIYTIKTVLGLKGK